MIQVAESLNAVVSRIAGDIRCRGYAQFSATDPVEHKQIVARLGPVLHRTRVSIRPEGRTYLSRAEAVPFHTDHPNVAVISWRCEAQDAGDGASLLVDAVAAIDALDPPTANALATVRMPCPDLLGLTRSHCRVLWEPSTRQVFFAPWLLPEGVTDSQRIALGALRDAIERAAVATRLRFRLDPGQCLAIDNRRMLHGRGPVHDGSTRTLERIWIG